MVANRGLPDLSTAPIDCLADRKFCTVDLNQSMYCTLAMTTDFSLANIAKAVYSLVFIASLEIISFPYSMASHGSKTTSLEEKNWLHQLQETAYQGKLLTGYHSPLVMPALNTALEPIILQSSTNL